MAQIMGYARDRPRYFLRHARGHRMAPVAERLRMYVAGLPMVCGLAWQLHL